MNRLLRLIKSFLFKMPIPLRRFIKRICDFCIIPFSCVLAFWLRFEWIIEAQYHSSLLIFMGQTLALSMIFFQLLGAYSEMWVYWSFRDLKRLMAIHTSIVLAIFLSNTVFHLYELPRSIYILYWMLAAGFLSGFRIAARLLMLLPATSENNHRRFLILGAGTSGEMLARLVLNSPRLHAKVVGFLDDNVSLTGRTIHGIKVLGTIDRLSGVVVQRNVQEIIIAVASASAKEMQRIVQYCEQTGVPFKIVPSVHELVSNEFRFQDIRTVKIEDLLGREQTTMDAERIGALLKGKVIMVTGAAGSIGSELCRQMLKFKPKIILAVDKDENQLFYLNDELQNPFFHPVVMQLENRKKLNHLFEQFHPQIIFHAAAYKHVPCMEWYPDEAIVNNFENTIHLVDMAYKNKVERFVQISTDKAVYPVSMMGVSKRLCELYIKYFTELGRTGFIVVRFGNVIGSQGSVFTIFQKQIQQRQPVTVTHPKMERYFMSIVEACRLVLEAAALGEGGCTFLLDMGEPIPIIDLARQMIRLSGLEPEKDIPILISDVRPGEKLNEKLCYDHESKFSTENSKIYKILGNGVLTSDFKKISEEIITDARAMDYVSMVEKIQKLIPEYSGGSKDNNK